jgi:PKD repeat protein
MKSLRHLLLLTVLACLSSYSYAQCKAGFTYKISNDTVSFTNTSTNNSQNKTFYSWTFGDNTTSTAKSPTHVYKTPGAYYACLTIWDSANCRSQYCDSFYVGSKACNFSISSRQDSTNALKFHFSHSGKRTGKVKWYVGNTVFDTSHSTSYTFKQSGTYYVCAKLDSCPIKCITVSVKSTTCNQIMRYYQDSTNKKKFYFSHSGSQKGKIKWTFDSSHTDTTHNPSYTFSTTGYHKVCMKIDSCPEKCISVYIQNTNCNQVISHTVDSANNLKYYFSHSGKKTGRIKWSIYGQNGYFDTSHSTSYTFKQSGYYTVCMQLDSCPKICTRIYAKGTSKCAANFTYSIQGRTVKFYPQTSGTNSNTTYKWHFGNQHTSTQKSPTITYSRDGTYWVCLAIATYDSSTRTYCKDTTCKYVTVKTNSSPCSNLKINISRDSIHANKYYFYVSGSNNFRNIKWKFGDGDTSIYNYTTHTYKRAGTYVVCVKVDTCPVICDTLVVKGNSGGCSANANFTYSGHSGGTGKVSFTNKSTGASHYKWDFGNRSTSTLKNPTHTYKQSGYYTVCLIAKGFDSTNRTYCYDTLCKKIYVKVGNNTNCNISMTIVRDSNSTHGNTYKFSHNGSQNGRVKWTFGDGTGSSYHKTSHSYTRPGTYIVCLEVDSCPKICDTLIVKGNKKCNADFTYSANGKTVKFFSADSNSAHAWTFGDRSGSIKQSPSHTYNSNGYYTVCHVVVLFDTRNQVICTDTVCKKIFVHDSINGINDLESKIGLFPNPASGYINLAIPSDIRSDFDVTIVDLFGRDVIDQRIEVIPGSSQYKLDLSGLTSGYYSLRIDYEGTEIRKKFIKQ